MKKLGMLFTMFVAVLFISGCGDKKLVCTQSQSDDGYDVKVTMTTSFNSKNIATKVDMDTVATFDEETAATQYYTLMESVANEQEGAKIKQDGKKVTLTMTSEPDEDDADINYTDARKKFEDEGYTCK